MNHFYFTGDAPTLSLTGKTLVIPVVSTANVSQLAADLLITSFSLHRIAIFDPQFFIPVVGGRDDAEEGITTPFELYGNVDTELLVIQQRSPVLKSRKQDFVLAILEFISAVGVGSVLFLSGMDLSNRMDSQMFTSTYYIRPENGPKLQGTPLHTLNSIPVPLYTPPTPETDSSENNIPFIPGSGLTRRILASLPEKWSVPTAVLLQFVLEGDNRADAHLFAATVVKVIGFDPSVEWKQPNSWAGGLFGTPQDQTLYG